MINRRSNRTAKERDEHYVSYKRSHFSSGEQTHSYPPSFLGAGVATADGWSGSAGLTDRLM